jgi:ribosomal protein S18 acetylase RimI-like enzyme
VTIEYHCPTLKNAEEIYRLGRAEFNWIFEKVSWDQSIVSWYINYFRSYCFIATDNKVIIGFHLSSTIDAIGYMGWVCVAPEYRHFSVGQALLEMTIKKMKKNPNIKNIYANARDDGIVLDWLKRSGFNDILERKVEVKLCLEEDTNE